MMIRVTNVMPPPMSGDELHDQLLLTMLTFSLEMVTASPSCPALPLTLMRSCRNFSNEAGSRTRSSTGMKQSITNFTVCFLEDFFDLG